MRSTASPQPAPPAGALPARLWPIVRSLDRAMAAQLLALLLPPAAAVAVARLPGPDLLLPTEHFFIVTVVSVLAALAALLVARAALLLEQLQVLLITLGFLCMAGFFTVHALATPGMLGAPRASTGGYSSYGYGSPAQSSDSGYSYRPEVEQAAGQSSGQGTGQDAVTWDYSGTVIGVSGILSIFVPALAFAASYSPLVAGLRRRRISTTAVLLVVVGGLVLYAVLALGQADLVASLLVSSPPYSYAVALASVVLLVYAAARQLRVYLRTRLPTHGALVLSFLWLAEAQVAMVVSRFWSPIWWGYHLLMLVATVIALGAVFLELDRRRGLERFLPAEVVERVVAGGMLRQGGERRVVTVLFADLRNWTGMTEQMPAEEVVEILNTYVGGLARCVFAHGGMLDKYLGDGLMAVFGVLPDESDGAAPAARAALEMRRVVAAINAERERREQPRFQFGVGIHTGEVVLGAIGLPQRSDFTAIGDTVNTASRLESLCKVLGRDVVVSDQVVDRLSGTGIEHEALGRVEVRGKQGRLRVSTLA